MNKKLLMGCGIAAGIVLLGVFAIFTFLVVLGMKIESGDMPDTRVLISHEILPPILEEINKHVELGPDEDVIFYYSSAMLNHADDMNIITNRQVILFKGAENGKPIYVPFDNIQSLEFEYKGSDWADSELLITTKNGNPPLASLTLSAEDGRDQKVVDYIYDQSGLNQY